MRKKHQETRTGAEWKKILENPDTVLDILEAIRPVVEIIAARKAHEYRLLVEKKNYAVRKP